MPTRPRLLALAALLLSVTACAERTSDPAGTRYDLAAAARVAEFHCDGLELDFGTDAARAFYGGGFSWNERSGEETFVWSSAESSRLYFPLLFPRDLRLQARALTWRSASGTEFDRPQRVWLQVADAAPSSGDSSQETPVLIFSRSDLFEDISLDLGASAWPRGGVELQFRYEYIRPPAEGDRQLAVAWNSMSLEGFAETCDATLDSLTLPQTWNRGEGVFELPALVVGRWKVDLFAGDRLVIRTLSQPAEGETVVLVREPDGIYRVLAEEAAPNTTLDRDLVVAEGGLEPAGPAPYELLIGSSHGVVLDGIHVVAGHR